MASITHPAQAKGRPELRPLGLAFLRRLLLQLGPALVFFAVFAWRGIAWGTAAFVAAALLSVAVSTIRRGRVPAMPLVTAALVACFGGLTLAYGEAAYVQMQPTIANALYAVVLGAGRLSGHDLLRRGFGSVLRLDGEGWRRLTWRVVGFLAALAVANEIVRLTASVESWIVFKAFVIGGLDLLFGLAQVPLLRAHWTDKAAAAA